MIGQAARYVAVGVVSVGIYVAATWVLATHQIVNRSGAVFIAFALATTFNYLANRYWSFIGDVPHRQAVTRYFILVVVGLIWNELGVELMSAWGVPLMAAVVSCIAIWPLVAFFGLRAWVFRPAISVRHNP